MPCYDAEDDPKVWIPDWRGRRIKTVPVPEETARTGESDDEMYGE